MADKYPSKYSNGKQVSAAQYITEVICEHKAKLDKLDLHYKFWINKEWSAFYKNQISSANALLKKYKDISIVKALNDPKCSGVYSLRSPVLNNVIQMYEKKLADMDGIKLTKNIDRKTNTKFNKNVNKPGILSKLKDIDNE